MFKVFGFRKDRPIARANRGEPGNLRGLRLATGCERKAHVIDVDDIDHDVMSLRSAPTQLLNPAGMNAGSLSSMNCFTSGELNT
ncbi:hypothetical protein ACVWXO_007144 [Bradyrhizobium sp. LM2.7]